jgi:hypothetical protein
MNGGLAFSEKRDIKTLEKWASKGWLFKDFAFGGFCYKLVQGPSQELTYTMDIQSNPDADYFEIFDVAGWRHITSIGNRIHVFCAPKGTPPIYSNNEIEEGKYKDFISSLGKWSKYSLMALVICLVALNMSKLYFELLFYPLASLTLISLTAFIFSFLPYVSYKFKEKKNQ